jgi:hypothetical protein
MLISEIIGESIIRCGRVLDGFNVSCGGCNPVPCWYDSMSGDSVSKVGIEKLRSALVELLDVQGLHDDDISLQMKFCLTKHP